MSTVQAKELKKIQKIIYKGRYYKALERLETLLEDKELTEEDSVKTRIVFCRTLKLCHQHSVSLKFLDNVTKSFILKSR